jgi:hypothetical protein
MPCQPHARLSDFNRVCGHLHRLHLSICLARVDLFSCLRDSLEDSLVVQRWLCIDGRGLGIERDVVGLDA